MFLNVHDKKYQIEIFLIQILSNDFQLQLLSLFFKYFKFLINNLNFSI